MSDQAGSGAVTGLPTEGGHVSPVSQHGPGEPFHGRAVSWVAVSIITLGFIVGGLGLIIGPTWWLFWVGVGLTVVGGLLALATNIFEDWY
ncbi:MAG TPA: HGxxPAAW family protein [Streptosporangiaceae bacterium]|jgi:hypothetical protein